MKAKIVVGIFLAVACLCLLAVKGVSQPKAPIPSSSGSATPPPHKLGAGLSSADTSKGGVHVGAPPLPDSVSVPGRNGPPAHPPIPSSVPKEGSWEQLAQQLRNIRQEQKDLANKQKALEAQEEDLLKSIDLKVEQQREALQEALQKAEELRKQIRQGKPQAGKKEIQNISEKKKDILDKDKNMTVPNWDQDKTP